MTLAENEQIKNLAKRLKQKKMQASKMAKRKQIVEKSHTAVKDAKQLLGAQHVELRQRLQKSRQTKTKREINMDVQGEQPSSQD